MNVGLTVRPTIVKYFLQDIYEVPPLFTALISPYSNPRLDLQHSTSPGIVTAEHHAAYE